MNNRLDAKDVKGKWYEATVVGFQEEQNSFVVHFKGFSSKWDESIKKESSQLDEKFAEVGLYSSAFGFAKYNKEQIMTSF